MGNNLKQKNIIQEMQKFSSLPYDSIDKIKFTEDNCYINSVTLNNVFNQLVQNDLYVNNELNTKASLKIGPKDSDQESIYNGANGYKYWNDNDGQMSIYRKVVKSYQDSLTEIEGNATLISRVNGEILVANIDCHAKYGRIEDINSQFGFDTEIKYKDASGNLYQIDIKSKCETDTQSVFSCRVVDTGKYGLFFIKKNDDDGVYYFELITETDGVAESVHTRDQNGQIVYCTDDGVWLLTLESGTVQTTNRIYGVGSGETKKPVIVRFLDRSQANYNSDNSILVIFNNGDMWISEKGTTSQNARSKVQSSMFSGDFDIYSTEQLNGRVFMSSKKGISYFDGDDIKQFRSCDVCGKLTLTQAGLLYACTSNGGSSIRSITCNQDGQYQDSELVHVDISDIETVYMLDGSYVYVAKNGVYSNIDGNIQEIFSSDLDIVDSLFYGKSSDGVLFCVQEGHGSSSLVRIVLSKKKYNRTDVPTITNVEYELTGDFVNSYLIQENQYIVSYDGTTSYVINAETNQRMYSLNGEKLLGIFECGRNAWFITDKKQYCCSSRQVANKASLKTVREGLLLDGVINCGQEIEGGGSDYTYCVLDVYDETSNKTYLYLIKIEGDQDISVRNFLEVGNSPGVYCSGNKCFSLKKDRTVGTFGLNPSLKDIETDIKDIVVSETGMYDILKSTTKIVDIGTRGEETDDGYWLETKKYLIQDTGDVRVISCRVDSDIEDDATTSRGMYTVSSGIKNIKAIPNRPVAYLKISSDNSFSIHCRIDSTDYDLSTVLYDRPSTIFDSSVLETHLDSLNDVSFLSSDVQLLIDAAHQQPGVVSGDLILKAPLVYSGNGNIIVDDLVITTNLTATEGDYGAVGYKALRYKSCTTARSQRAIWNGTVDRIESDGSRMYVVSGHELSSFSISEVMTTTDLGSVACDRRVFDEDIQYIGVDDAHQLVVVATKTRLFKFSIENGITSVPANSVQYKDHEIGRFIDLYQFEDDNDSMQIALFDGQLADGLVISQEHVYADDDYTIGEIESERFIGKTADKFKIQGDLITLFSSDSKNLAVYDTTAKGDIETAIDVVECNCNIGDMYVCSYSKPGNLQCVIVSDEGEWYACNIENNRQSNTIRLTLLDQLAVKGVLFGSKGNYDDPYVITETDVRTIGYGRIGHFPSSSLTIGVDGTDPELISRNVNYTSFYVITTKGGYRERYGYDDTNRSVRLIDQNRQIAFVNNVDSIDVDCQIRINPDGVQFGNDDRVLKLVPSDLLARTLTVGTQVIAMLQTGEQYHILYKSGSNVHDIIISGVSSGICFNDTGYSISESPSGSLTVEANDILIVAEKKLYKYTFDREEDGPYIYGYLVLTSDSEYSNIEQISESDSKTFFLGDGHNLLSSSDANSWSSIFHVEQEYDIADVCPVDLRNIFVVADEAAANHHVLYTKYSYDCVNDTKPFTYEDAYALYTKKVDDINDKMTRVVSEHEQTDHGQDDHITEVNKYTTTDFEIENFTQTGSAPGGITNDYIEDVKFGSSDDTIMVQATNTANGSTVKTIQCDYIMKCWNSGLVDLYVHLPTTYTYYVPHIPYAGNCKAQSDTQVTVNGKKITNSISENYTTITMKLMSTFFNLGNVTENTINGMSLPLNINRDKTSDAADLEVEASNLFHSMIQPSLAYRGVDYGNIQNEFYTLNYFCFGTDEQAIHISYYDDKKVFTKKYKEVVYHSRYTDETNTDKTVKQRFLQGEASKELLDNMFENNTAFFIGWTSIRSDYSNREARWTGASLSYDDIEGSKIDLYAVWNTYEFSDDDTTITVNARANVAYNIRSMTIDPTVQLDGNLNNSIIVDFDYSS